MRLREKLADETQVMVVARTTDGRMRRIAAKFVLCVVLARCVPPTAMPVSRVGARRFLAVIRVAVAAFGTANSVFGEIMPALPASGQRPEGNQH
ncbi:MAG TPA: hypothetical protein VKU82_07200 [Planctomycetaceae bacterium]|nr:hypothetical protein [Planctomycetaceae bacterium]